MRLFCHSTLRWILIFLGGNSHSFPLLCDIPLYGIICLSIFQLTCIWIVCSLECCHHTPYSWHGVPGLDPLQGIKPEIEFMDHRICIWSAPNLQPECLLSDTVTHTSNIHGLHCSTVLPTLGAIGSFHLANLVGLESHQDFGLYFPMINETENFGFHWVTENSHL